MHEFLKDKIQNVTQDPYNTKSQREELALGDPPQVYTVDIAPPSEPEAIDSLDHDPKKLHSDSSKKSSNTTISVAPSHRKSSRGRLTSSELSSKKSDPPNHPPITDSEKLEFLRIKSKIEKFQSQKANVLQTYLGKVYNLKLGDKIIKIPQTTTQSVKKRLEKLGKEESEVRDGIFDYLEFGQIP